MTRMWRGPSPELQAARNDRLYAEIIRRAGRLGISFSDNHQSGRKLTASTISKGKDGDWYQRDIGDVEAADPTLAVLWASHRFTPLDGELLGFHHQYLERLAENIVLDGHMIVSKLEAAAGEFAA
jgi:hypothetical protein